jgi:hypothetical protein
MGTSRTILILIGVLPLLASGCAVFRQETPEIAYVVKLSEPGSAVACDDLASLFANQAALRINPFKPPALPAGQYCDVTLTDTNGNHNDVSLTWNGQGIQIVVRQHGGLGLTTPNSKTMRLADQLIEVTTARYTDAEVKQVKVYSNPFFGP